MTTADSRLSYAGETVLVTGGTGSFGKTVARHLLDRDVREIRILSRDEAKQHDMRVLFGDARLNFYVGDVRSRRSVERAMRGVNLVFHAAALKQVPSCEFFPTEAFETNVGGSRNVIEAAEDAHVSSVVCLSTDKAVYPVNAMGMTKALMEKVAQAAARAARSDTIVSTVRYGNVLYSRGSVVPLYVDKIFRGEPLPITDPNMTRFLMPLSHAVELVEFAFFNARPGDTFVRKAPAARIGDLASAINDLFGNPVGEKVIGIRHGEKRYETLATAEELRFAEDMGKYWRLRVDSRDLNYADYFEFGQPAAPARDFDSNHVSLLDIEELKTLLYSLPEIQTDLLRWEAS